MMMRLVNSASAICSILISTAVEAASTSSLGQQFIAGHSTLTFSIVVPYIEGEKRVENVKVTCDEGKCRVRVASILQRACSGGTSDSKGAVVPSMIQIEEYRPDDNDPLFRPVVTPGDDGMLLIHYIDSGQEAHLRVLLRWEESALPNHKRFITSGRVVGEEEIAAGWPSRYEPISEIVGSPIICHARFQSR